MSSQIYKQIIYIVSETMTVVVASTACLVDVSGSFFPVFNCSVSALSCGFVVKDSFKIGFTSDSVAGKISICISGIFFSIATLFYFSVAVVFFNCVKDLVSDVTVYDSTDKCDEIAKIALAKAFMLFSVGVIFLVTGCTINMINDYRRRGREVSRCAV